MLLGLLWHKTECQEQKTKVLGDLGLDAALVAEYYMSRELLLVPCWDLLTQEEAASERQKLFD